MGPESRLYILDTFWDRQEHEAAAFSLQAISLYFTCLANGHSRMYKASDISAMLEAAGFVAEVLGLFPLRLQFASWTERMRTPEPAAAQIRALFAGAPESVRDALMIEDDGTFTCPVVLMRGRLGG